MIKYGLENKKGDNIIMKRTAERVLSWIGVGITALSFLVTIYWIFNYIVFANSTKEALVESGLYSNSEAETYISTWSVISIISVILAIIFLILSILSAIWIGKKTKAAGIILLVSGIINFFSINFVAGILWIIAGIMLLVRKPKQPIDQGAYHNYNNNQQTHTNNQDFIDNDSRRYTDEVKDDPYKY